MSENGRNNPSRRSLRLLLRRARCPDEQQLAAFVDHRLDPSRRNWVESHLAKCEVCRSQVAFLLESADWKEPETIPPALLSKARGLGPASVETVSFSGRWAAAVAVGACLMFVVVLALVFRFWQSRNSIEQPLVAQTQNVPAPPIDSPIANATPEALAGSPKNGGGETLPRRPKTDKSPAVGVRSAEITAAGPRLLSPGEGSVMDADKLTVSWNPVATATFYETSIVSAAGDPVFQARTEATHLRLPAEVKLVRGAKYFVWVSATLEEGKTVKSNMVSFRAR